MTGSRQRADGQRSPLQPQRPSDAESFVSLKWRRGYRLGLSQLVNDALILIESGCVTCDAIFPGPRRQILMVLYPGDMFCRSFAPPLPDLQLTATTNVSLKRLRSELLENERAADDLRRRKLAAATELVARTCLLAAARGRLTAEERLATLLAEMALHLGRPAPGGHTFEVPLSRTDMADYLALNADSLSRIMSRFRASGLISTPKRNLAIARKLDALLAATPLGSALSGMISASGAQRLRGPDPAGK